MNNSTPKNLTERIYKFLLLQFFLKQKFDIKVEVPGKMRTAAGCSWEVVERCVGSQKASTEDNLVLESLGVHRGVPYAARDSSRQLLGDC